MQRLLILRCSDPQLWYRDLIGRTAPLVSNLPESEGSWLSCEPTGYLNVVRKRDAMVLPTGYLPVHTDMLIQRGDFVRRDDAWIGSTPEEWGTLVGQRVVVREYKQGSAGC